MTATGTTRRSGRPVLYRLTEIIRPDSPALVDLERLAAETAFRPDPSAPKYAHRVIGAAVEYMGGRRPASQLAGVLRADVLDRLTILRGWVGHLRPRLRNVGSQQTTPGVLEAWALVELRTGHRAMSACFELLVDHRGTRWQCTALQLHYCHKDDQQPR